MNSDTAITVEGLSKAYRIGVAETRRDTLFGSVTELLKAPVRNFRNLRRLDTSGGGEGADTLWALRDVSFEVQKGEVLGIIGRNGAGKSTLLKILSRITEPTAGEIRMRGRVSSLLEVGTGFHPELTGRENIYMNGTILGMRKVEIDRKFDEIVEFSGVERFLDTPIKRYSSGQKVRLAFSVAAHLEPEILIVDEVLAVGDMEFQKKCIGRMKEVAKGGERTVLFVSHNMAAVLNLCNRAIVLEDGRVISNSDAPTGVARYQAYRGEDNVFRAKDAVRTGMGGVRLVNLRIAPASPVTGGSLRFDLDLERDGPRAQLDFDISVALQTAYGEKLLQLYSRHMDRSFRLGGGTGTVSVRVPCVPLAPGHYHVNVWIGSGAQAFDFLEDCMTLRVSEGSLAERTVAEHRGYPVMVASEWTSIEASHPIASPGQSLGHEAAVLQAELPRK